MPESVDPTLLITKEQLAADLRITIRGLNKMIRRGEVPEPFHIGRKAYWRKQTIVEFLLGRERKMAK